MRKASLCAWFGPPVQAKCLLKLVGRFSRIGIVYRQPVPPDAEQNPGPETLWLSM
ncbi:hypothetical protein [Paenibacillus chitinolyticus]|uniref:hypothetical protein n=1 Tax=Paenibacillus chitinolyticus TaxID=79263 RepID=UPI003CFECC5D